MLLLLLLVLLLLALNQLADESADFCLKVTRQLVDKLHALLASCLHVTLLKVILNELVWFIFVLIDVFWSQRDIGEHEYCEKCL